MAPAKFHTSKEYINICTKLETRKESTVEHLQFPTLQFENGHLPPCNAPTLANSPHACATADRGKASAPPNRARSVGPAAADASATVCAPYTHWVVLASRGRAVARGPSIPHVAISHGGRALPFSLLPSPALYVFQAAFPLATRRPHARTRHRLRPWISIFPPQTLPAPRS